MPLLASDLKKQKLVSFCNINRRWLDILNPEACPKVPDFSILCTAVHAILFLGRIYVLFFLCLFLGIKFYLREANK